MRLETHDPLVERDRAAARSETVGLALRTLAERTQPAEIIVTLRLEQEHVELMADDTDAGSGFERFPQRVTGRAAQFAKTVLGFQPQRQIEVAALMPDLDALAAELGKTRNLLPQQPRDGADHGHRPDLVEPHPCIGHHVRRHAKFPLALEQVAVLFGDRAAAHGIPLPLRSNSIQL